MNNITLLRTLAESTGEFYFEEYMVYVWLGVFVLAVIVELATSDLISLWFAGGALLSLFISLIPGAPFWVEIIVFAVSSLLLLLLIRPLAKNKLLKKKPDIKFNADDMIGKKATVIKSITELNRGEVLYHNIQWTAESVDNTPIEKGSVVIITGIEGNKLKVKKETENKEE